MKNCCSQLHTCMYNTLKIQQHMTHIMLIIFLYLSLEVCTYYVIMGMYMYIPVLFWIVTSHPGGAVTSSAMVFHMLAIIRLSLESRIVSSFTVDPLGICLISSYIGYGRIKCSVLFGICHSECYIVQFGICHNQCYIV